MANKPAHPKSIALKGDVLIQLPMIINAGFESKNLSMGSNATPPDDRRIVAHRVRVNTKALVENLTGNNYCLVGVYFTHDPEKGSYINYVWKQVDISQQYAQYDEAIALLKDALFNRWWVCYIYDNEEAGVAVRFEINSQPSTEHKAYSLMLVPGPDAQYIFFLSKHPKTSKTDKGADLSLYEVRQRK